MPLALLHLLLLRLFFPPAPAPPEPDLSRLESAKNVGLAALEEGNLEEARKRFEEVRRLAPAEPLGWANGAIAAMRGKDLPRAKELLAEALRRAPDGARVLALEGARRELAGETAPAIEAFEKAAAADASDLSSRWAAARILTEKVPGGGAQALRIVESALE